MAKTPPTHKLAPIEGLRGYLALMVMICHIFTFGAFVHLPAYFHADAGGILDVIDHGSLAVNCFMIVSGFVIFMLIDTKREPYRVFFLRRFLRIFPVYFLLFLLALPAQWVSGLTLYLIHPFQSDQVIQETRELYARLWSNLWIHAPLHLVMLHGMVPTTWLPNSGTAFLGPAWSLSLEWQFYLVAPLWFSLFLTRILWQRLLMFAVCLFFIVKSHYLFPNMEQGAFLLLQLPFFIVGGVSYFIYAGLGQTRLKGDLILPIAVLVPLGMYQLSNKALGLVPFMIWLVVFALLLEPREAISFRLLAPIFTNRVSLWLGKTSYSIYLSHALVLTLMQYLVLRGFPGITQTHLLEALLFVTPAVTLPLSGLLYRTIEAPCIRWGKKISGETTEVVLERKGA